MHKKKSAKKFMHKNPRKKIMHSKKIRVKMCAQKKNSLRKIVHKKKFKKNSAQKNHEKN